MKKMIRLLALLPVLVLAACGDTTPKDDDGHIMYTTYGPNFSTVCDHGYLRYLRDTDTNIMYIFWSNGSTGKKAALSVYYNAEGQPMTYGEFLTVHTAKYHHE